MLAPYLAVCRRQGRCELRGDSNAEKGAEGNASRLDSSSLLVLHGLAPDGLEAAPGHQPSGLAAAIYQRLESLLRSIGREDRLEIADKALDNDFSPLWLLAE